MEFENCIKMKSIVKRLSIWCGIALLAPSLMQAKVVLPHFITDNMVLQQKSELTIPGNARPGSEVKVIPSWDNKTYTATADASGKFGVALKTPAAGGPYTITFDDGEVTTLKNVMSGEVWLCSGQSNMEMPVVGWGKVMNYEVEAATANYPNIRLLQVRKNITFKPVENPEVNMGGWQPCTPQTVPDFSSIAYFYARELASKLNVPVGVIDCTWGGTPAEAWTSYEALIGVAGFEKELKRLKDCNFDATAIQANYEKELETWVALANAGAADLDKAVYHTDWEDMPVPALYESTVLPGFDGITFMQCRIEIPAEAVNTPVTLRLGMIDDEDIVYFNGEKIGAGSGYNVQRTYTVPAHLVKAGEAVVTVRVSDFGGEGGIYGNVSDVYAQVGEKKLSLAGNWKYKVAADFSKLPAKPVSITSSSYPSVLYNAMLSPLQVLPVKGFLWYQGCANVGRDKQYSILFKTMIEDWRKLWGDKPFYFVQLAGYLAPRMVQPHSEWAALRQAQADALALENTGMAVAIDLGDPYDIHPKNKQEVARRLSLIALNRDYGMKCEYEAPMVKKSEITENAIILTFDGKVSAKVGNINGFIVGDATGKYAVAEVKQIAKNKLQISSPEIKTPVNVKYNWADYPCGNLVGVSSRLPVAPFQILK